MKVATATVKYGNATIEVYSVPGGKSETREALEITTVSDTVKKFMPGALTEEDEFTLSLKDKGEGMPSVSDEPKALEITVTLSGGATDKTVTVSYSKVIVTKVVPGTVEGSGDRKATLDVTFRPTGE